MLKNLTKSTIISKKTVFFRNIFSQALGLRFRNPRPDTAYIFPLKKDQKCIVDNVFVFSPIYILFLDKNKRITRIHKLKPFRFIAANASFIIELGSVKNIHKGDKLTF